MEIISIVVSVVSAVVAVGALVAGVYFGRRQAKAAEDQAQISGDSLKVAGAAVTQAEGVAEDARNLAEQANETARRALAAQLDQQVIQWAVEVESPLKFPCGVTLRAAEPVTDVTVVVSDNHGRVVETRADECCPMVPIELELSGIWDEHLKRVLSEQGIPAFSSGDMFFAGSAPKPVELCLSFAIGCRTQSGVLRSNTFEHKVRHRNRGGEE